MPHSIMHLSGERVNKKGKLCPFLLWYYSELVTCPVYLFAAWL